MQANGKNFIHLSYRISNHVDNCENIKNKKYLNFINNEIAIFMTEKATNVNFFVVDKKGNPIYVNQSLEETARIDNIKIFVLASWENNLQVIKSKKQNILKKSHRMAIIIYR
jgi:hypothetical protein